MVNSGQTNTAQLVAMLSERAAVNVKLALVGNARRWQLHHGQVTLDDDTSLQEQAWRYSTALFLESRLPGPTVAALLRGEEQDVHGIRVICPGPSSATASTYRLRGREEWDRVSTPWPRTEWTISRDTNAAHPGYGLLVGDGPSFLNFDQALSAFLHQRPYDPTTNRADLWRITLPQRVGWLSQITISPDLLTAVIDGETLQGAELELSWAAGTDGGDRLRRPGEARSAAPTGERSACLVRVGRGPGGSARTGCGLSSARRRRRCPGGRPGSGEERTGGRRSLRCRAGASSRHLARRGTALSDGRPSAAGPAALPGGCRGSVL